jgi:hypothetical protein
MLRTGTRAALRRQGNSARSVKAFAGDHDDERPVDDHRGLLSQRKDMDGHDRHGHNNCGMQLRTPWPRTLLNRSLDGADQSTIGESFNIVAGLGPAILSILSRGNPWMGREPRL